MKSLGNVMVIKPKDKCPREETVIRHLHNELTAHHASIEQFFKPCEPRFHPGKEGELFLIYSNLTPLQTLEQILEQNGFEIAAIIPKKPLRKAA